MTPGIELLIHDRIATRRREADRERLTRAAPARNQRRIRAPRIRYRSWSSRLARLAVQHARVRLGGKA